MFDLLTQKVKPIGLDIGYNSIRMIQFAVSGGRVSAIAADEVPFNHNINGDLERRRTFVVDAVRRMLERSRFRGREVVSCLPNEELIIKSLRIDACDSDKTEQLLKNEVAQRFGLDIETHDIRYMVAGSVQQGNEIKNELIVFAAGIDYIKKHIQTLEQARLSPVAIDTVPCALFRSLERSLRRQEDQEIVNVFVDVGAKFTTVVVGRGRDICFVKQITVGGQNFNEEIAAALGVSADEAVMLRAKLKNPTAKGELDPGVCQLVANAMKKVVEQLAREISLCFKYYAVTFRGTRPGRAIFTGGDAYEETLLEELRRQLAVEIEIAQPLYGFDIRRIDFGRNKTELGCEWAVAVGLGLKGWDTDTVGMDMYERN